MSYAFDSSTSTFTFIYMPNASISQPTEIIVPARIYPNGFQVTCGGCETTFSTTEVIVTKPAAGPTTTVTIQP